MHTRQLGNSDLHITPIGLGAWAIGGEWLFGWGPQDDSDSVAVIRHAIKRGINWIDTAPVYGLGHSEEVVARALKDVPHRERPYVFTKCSLVWDESRTVSHSLNPASLRRECDASLSRLQVERIDLYQIHWPRWPTNPSETGSLEDAWSALVDLKAAGKVRYIGVSNFNADQLAAVHRIAPVTSLQPPYSILRRDIETRELPWCEAHGVGVLAYSPMMSGLLSGSMTRDRIASLPEGDWRRRALWFQEPNLTRALGLVELMKEIASNHRCTPAEVAIAWVLRHPIVTGAIVGARRPEQIDGFIGAAHQRLTDTEMSEIDVQLGEKPRSVAARQSAGGDTPVGGAAFGMGHEKQAGPAR
jgi:aryl-alcohol dehydrogenase-like predicted oxidoreductase